MKIKVSKFDPAVDAAPRYVEGEVAYRDYMTALEALVEFHENVEPISFDYGCGSRCCGRCACMIDGEAKLPCVTMLSDGEHVFDPLPTMDVVRDLVVDRSASDRHLAEVLQRVWTGPITREGLAPKDYVHDPHLCEIQYVTEECTRCGICDVHCPALQANPGSYVGPRTLMAIGFRSLDHYDMGNRIVEAVGAGLYHCIQCGMCDEVCPKMVRHADYRKLLFAAADERGLKPDWA